MVPERISIDIVQYLLEKKGFSRDEAASALGTTVSHIKKIQKRKASLESEHINAYLKFSNQHFWEFAIEAIPLNHLSEKARNRVLLCKELHDHIEKKKKNS